MPSDQGGLIDQIGFVYFSNVPVTITVNLTQGSTVISSYRGTLSAAPTGSGMVSYAPNLITNNTLLPGQTYVFSGSISDGSLSNMYASYTPLYRIKFETVNVDSSAVGTVLTVNGTNLSYSSLPSYSLLAQSGDVIVFNYASIVNTTVAKKLFLYSSCNASSPFTVSSSSVTISANYTVYNGVTISSVTVKGPYFEDGSVASNNSVTFSLLYVNGTTYTHTLQSTASVGSVSLTSLSDFLQLSWNATSVSSTFNATRVYRFANGVNGIDDSTVYLFILNPNKPAYQYTFSVTDFYGMVNPYLQTTVSPTGNGSIPVERVDLKDGGGYVTFVLQQYQLYGLTFVCQQGTYSQTFTPTLLGAPGQNPVTLSVLSGNFPSTNATTGVTYAANRTSNNVIQASYLDASGNTTSVNVQITHASGSQTIIDYESTGYGSSQVFSWSLADEDTSYTVLFTAVSGGVTYSYRATVPSVAGDNPWALIDWDTIGQYIPTLPATYTGWGGIDPTQMIAAFLILAALGIGSYFSTGISCLICWVIAGLLLAMGWWQGSIPLFALAGFFTILVAVDEYKRGNFAL